MSNKHTATYQGKTFKRVSKGRTYTHMVVVVESIASQRARAERRARDNWAMNLGHRTQIANSAEGERYRYSDGTLSRSAITEEERQHARDIIAKGEQGMVDQDLRDFDESMAEHGWKTEDGLGTMYSAGWCSRLDLAQKLAAQHGGIILEVVRS